MTNRVIVSGEYEAEVLEHQSDDAVKVRSLETGRVYTVPASEIEYEESGEIIITRAQLAALLEEVRALRKAVRLVEQSNGYGLDVPSDYTDNRAWIITVGAARACKRARELQSNVV